MTGYQIPKLFPVCLLFLASPCYASERATGTYDATRACDAYSSFSKAKNPGSVRTRPGEQYEVVEVNKAGEYDWIRIEVHGAEPQQRWVARECGVAKLDAMPSGGRGGGGGGGGSGGGGGAGNMCTTPNKHDSFVLAITWQPGFCEHKKFDGTKPECDALANGDLVVDHLTLHGLWPNRKECGINYGRCKASNGTQTPFSLSEETVSRISPWMPNFYYGTTFGKYEWDKHGTCQPLSADDYFNTAVSALQLIDESKIGKAIKENIGGSFNVANFFSAIEQEYGSQVANNIMLVCTGKNYLQEIQVKLPLNFAVNQGIPKLIGGSGFGNRAQGCGKDARVEASGMD